MQLFLAAYSSLKLNRKNIFFICTRIKIIFLSLSLFKSFSISFLSSVYHTRTKLSALSFLFLFFLLFSSSQISQRWNSHRFPSSSSTNSHWFINFLTAATEAHAPSPTHKFSPFFIFIFIFILHCVNLICAE